MFQVESRFCNSLKSVQQIEEVNKAMENSTPSPFPSFTDISVAGESQPPGFPISRLLNFAGVHREEQSPQATSSSPSSAALVTGHSWSAAAFGASIPPYARTVVLGRSDHRIVIPQSQHIRHHYLQPTRILRNVVTPQEETEKGASGPTIMAVTGMDMYFIRAEQYQVEELGIGIRQAFDSVPYHGQVPTPRATIIQNQGLLGTPLQAHLTATENRIMTVLGPNSEAGIVWEIQFSATHDGQQIRTELGLVTPSTFYSSTLMCPHCMWNCRMQLYAEAETQGASIVLKRLNLVRICIQNGRGIQNNVHSDNFCVLVRVRCENTSNETYWKTTV